MNKFIRQKMKIARLQRREAMIYGEITPAKKGVMEKYDVYLEEDTDIQDIRIYTTTEDLYRSYNCKQGLSDLAKRMILESPLYYGDGMYLSNPKFKKVQIVTERTCILLNDTYVRCTRVLAKYIYECKDNDPYTPDYEVSKTKSLFYFVDDSIEW